MLAYTNILDRREISAILPSAIAARYEARLFHVILTHNAGSMKARLPGALKIGTKDRCLNCFRISSTNLFKVVRIIWQKPFSGYSVAAFFA
jgi:hypothetical protein